ncbi:PRC-barrel domain-containing protein [Pedobacter sp. N23S346]|uniref:PRC-barrel domain-containing protein n=1 Tax=Pedobacter sp. N23S346 TaxID=3402750 RepID=UPI003AC27ECE
MEQRNIIYSNLEELSNSSYELTEGEADIRGWKVKTEAGATIGKVRDLLFDPENNAVRYTIIDLDNLGADLEEKAVLIPIGLGRLSDDKDELILPDIHLDQFKALPQYIIGEVTHELEDRIRHVIGSPAALRMEETIIEIDRENFYQHHHFDKGNLTQRGTRISEANSLESDPLVDPERIEERNTIHQLIDHSEKKD